MVTTDSVRKIKGIGEKLEQCLNKLNIYTVGDLLEHYPREYEEFRPVQPISSMAEGEIAAVEGTLMARPKLSTHGKLKVLTISVQDESGVVSMKWYNMPFLRNQLRLGVRYLFRGRVTRKRDRLLMEQPKIFTKEEFYRLVGKLRPVYPLTAGITNNALNKAVSAALSEIEDCREFLPADIRRRRELVSYKSALKQIHFPANREELLRARKRLVFDELFLYSLALSYIRKNGKKKSCFRMEEKEAVGELIQSLPFSLTAAQERVYSEIRNDMQSGIVMNRLVQGDVGSGKTIIAVLALYQTVLCGGQGAFMAPTETLANQHYKLLQEILSERGVAVGLLTGSLTAKQKREGREKLASGEWDIVVGTHAIIQDGVEFKKLELVITDEQHRFGVKQRESLFKKGREPHTLAMSATPIPRTLALILYGDMDLSVVDERPANRLPVKNCVVDTAYRPNAYRFMKNQIDLGRQVYIICPMVDESEEMELENVTIYTEELREIFPPSVRIASLHGKMKPGEKEAVMADFSDGKTDILVSTTVIEVGIDVPNAAVMMIENAERFGLAQLHQLRGRVGRGKEQSYCIFMTGHASKESMERLHILAESNDGFFIAEEDLKLRGQGDLFGIRQSGENLFVLADIFEDAELLRQAGEEARLINEADIKKMCQKNEVLSEKIGRYLGQAAVL